MKAIEVLKKTQAEKKELKTFHDWKTQRKAKRLNQVEDKLSGDPYQISKVHEKKLKT